ncbi:FG-GAP-like repeat-containing protein [Pseudotenacibaculum haliotis]|uniref:FG-GAP-like repeat-containing protein n=1 Tax=Pseudotenacibaculum haliotis TaxID=1862138 RepID=A0ABW5LNI6_9FLAO
MTPSFSIIRKVFLVFSLFFSQLIIGQTLLFGESANSRGVAYAYGSSVYGGGVSFADFNNDGWDDLTYATDETKEVYFFQNNNGTFTQVDLGINHLNRVKQVLWVDYDNDGDKDFLATSITGINKFYRNDGNLSFTDITNTCGLFTDNLFTYGATFGDMDNDGDLDVFISNRDETFTQHNYLYRNDGGTFTDVTTSVGINLGSELSFCASFFDYDNDGDQDIYVANDKVANINRLYQNNGNGTFTDVSVSSGAGIAIDAMSTTIGDYNKDGWFDVYVTHTNGNNLLKNNGDGTFTNVAVATGTSFDSIAWGAVFLDADNDTELDLYVSGMLDGSDPNRISAAFYHNQGDGTFVIPNNIGFHNDTKSSFANAIGDVNNDGLPDIVVMNNGGENNFLWENKTITSNSWIKIKLEGVTSNKDGIGNKIEIHANGESQYRYTVCGEGYLGQNSSSEFVGLKDATNIDYIKVTWNTTGQVETINNITPNQSITIQEGNGVLSTDDENFSNLSIYPNPSDDGLFYIKNPTQESLNYRVFNILGKELTKGTFSLETSIDLSSFSSGIYLVKVSSSNKSQAYRIVKK